MPLPLIPAITAEYLVLGEGAQDAAFVRHLCAAHSINGFQIEDAGGTGKFETYLKGLSGRQGYGALKGIAVVADNDDTPDDNFRQVRKYLKNARLPQPNTPLKVARFNTGPSVMVVMLPLSANGQSSRGCLETVLLPSVRQHLPAISACMDAYSTCIDLEHWPSGSKADKFRVRAVLAAAWQKDPNASLSYLVAPDKNLIQLNHPSLQPIVEVLRNLPTSFQA